AGPSPGARGPDLDVGVDARPQGRLVFDVVAGGQTFTAVVEPGDAPRYRLGSVGAPGLIGQSGSDGWGGSNGSNYQHGGAGGAGGDGGPGGPGGDGGDVRVHLTPASAPSLALVGTMVRSDGGAGGPGGAGGSGGRGGSGGFSRSASSHTDANGNTV